MTETYISPGEAARRLHVGYRVIERACNNGRMLYIVTPGGRRRIPVSEVERYLTEHTGPLRELETKVEAS